MLTLEDDDDFGYLSPEKFIKVMREEIQGLTDLIAGNRVSNIEEYRNATGKIMGMKKSLELYINKKK